MTDSVREKLIESINFKASIELEIDENDQQVKNVESIRVRCGNKEVMTECLQQIEEYLLHGDFDLVNEINKEKEQLKYSILMCPKSRAMHFITLDSYNSCSLIRLLTIRMALIETLSSDHCSGFNPTADIGNWQALGRHNSIVLAHFTVSTGEPLALIQEKMKNKLNERLALKGTNYFAFRISNGTISEPYILKLSNGKIQEVICSTSGHASSTVHSDLRKFIKNNNPACKISSTLPLQHDGNCTRYSDYALIQFQYLSEMHGADKAFSLLSKNKPYAVNEKIFLDFQMFSRSFGFDLIKKRMYPLPEAIANQIVSKSLPKDDHTDASTIDISHENTSTEEKKESKNQRQQKLSECITWMNKLKEKRDELHQRYPQYLEEDTSNAYGAACQLINTLDTYVQRYIEQKMNLQEFKENSSKAIQANRSGVLSQHRGIKEIVINLLLAIGTLGIGYVLGVLFTQRANPIKCNTDSEDLLEKGIRVTGT